MKIVRGLIRQIVYEVDLPWALDGEWYAKMPHYPYCASHGSEDYQYFPHAKYVVLIRDPRDSLREQFLRIDANESWHGLYGVGVTDVAEHYSNEMLQKIYKVLTLDMDTLVVQFERLCLFPVETSRSIPIISYWSSPLRRG